MSKLLTRNEFRNGVFARDNHKCVICKQPAVDAHHIMERRLFTAESEFGGYFLENGASVCEPCHIACEETIISTKEVREKAGIKYVVLPEHLYDDQEYDKWGNPVQPNGYRLKGELFNDESVQKILKPVLHFFAPYIKYPRTHHLPWSLGMHDDDRMHESTNQWEGKEVVVTLKMDGENTTMYDNHIHARSTESKKHPSRDWVKNFWSRIAHNIPKGWRICGENLYAKHSISYEALDSYFYGFSVWDDKNVCQNWTYTRLILEELKIPTVPVLYEGIYDESLLRKLHSKLNFVQDEGYVLRLADEFHYSQFRKYVGKFVRPDHIKTTKHWMHGQEMVVNGLK
jgi:hypothetical protein